MQPVASARASVEPRSDPGAHDLRGQRREDPDLRVSETQRPDGHDADALCADVGAYGPCLRVSQVAHELELWGVIAPRGRQHGRDASAVETYVPADHWPRLVGTQDARG
jgi:hypothetical protein